MVNFTPVKIRRLSKMVRDMQLSDEATQTIAEAQLKDMDDPQVKALFVQFVSARNLVLYIDLSSTSADFKNALKSWLTEKNLVDNPEEVITEHFDPFLKNFYAAVEEQYVKFVKNNNIKMFKEAINTLNALYDKPRYLMQKVSVFEFQENPARIESALSSILGGVQIDYDQLSPGVNGSKEFKSAVENFKRAYQKLNGNIDIVENLESSPVKEILDKIKSNNSPKGAFDGTR
jgi:hypothetical protein